MRRLLYFLIFELGAILLVLTLIWAALGVYLPKTPAGRAFNRLMALFQRKRERKNADRLIHEAQERIDRVALEVEMAVSAVESLRKDWKAKEQRVSELTTVVQRLDDQVVAMDEKAKSKADHEAAATEAGRAADLAGHLKDAEESARKAKERYEKARKLLEERKAQVDDMKSEFDEIRARLHLAELEKQLASMDSFLVSDVPESETAASALAAAREEALKKEAESAALRDVAEILTGVDSISSAAAKAEGEEHLRRLRAQRSAVRN